MASPLHYFRKHQGYILAVLGVILIVTWVIGPSVLNLFEPSNATGSSSGDAEVVATWKQGNITRGDLNRMGWEHQAVIRFLAAVVERATREGATPQAPFLSMNRNGSISLGIPMSISDPALVQVLILAQKAKELGVEVDQKAVDDYLDNLGGYVLAKDDFQALAVETLSELRHPETKTRLVTVSQLYDRLKLELAALQARQMVLSGLEGSSTGELWEYHGKLHRRYKIEAYPIQVADYKGKIKASDAKEEDLRKLYDEGKNRPPDPNSADPGFRKPRRIAFGYAKVDFAKHLEAAKKQIPEERVVEEYQKETKAGNFRKLKLPTTEPAQPPGSKSGQSPPPTDKPSATDKPAGDSKSDAPQATEGDKSKEKGKTDQGAAEKTAEPQKSQADSKESPANEGDGCQTEPATGPKSETEKGQDPPVSQADEKAKSGDQDTKAKPPADTSSAGEPKATPAGDAAEKTDEQPKTDEQEFKPLSEVRDEILTRLARPEAQATSEAAVKAVMREVQDYSVKYLRWTQSKKTGGKTTAKDPGELRINSLASKHHLIVGEMPLADQFEIAATELGSHVGNAYFEDRPLFAPLQTESFLGEGTIVYWRTQDEPSAEVPYEKARPQVVEVWVNQRAAEAARKDAEALAAKAGKAESLKDALPEDEAKKVLQPLPFSWLTVGNIPLVFNGSVRLTEVIGIPLAGREFMEAVFSLNVGQTGVAINQPHNTVYVVRILGEEPSLDIRREMFLSSLQAGFNGNLARYAAEENQQLAAEVFEGVEKEYDFKWVGTLRFDRDM